MKKIGENILRLGNKISFLFHWNEEYF